MIDEIIRSKRRTLGLTITPEARVIVRAPWRASMEEIQRWVDRNLAWIQKHRTRLQTQRHTRVVLPPEQQFELETRYREQAKLLLPQRVALMAERASLTYQSVRISSARMRWGSCSRQGRLHFSWRLSMAPLWVVDYVVAHELAHLIHPNHSSRFWSKVADLYPDFKAARRWLRENHNQLPL